ncbi:5-methylcytosine-specific restriction protein A [Beijerinckia sp. GAS462]|nr:MULTISPECIES: HNH endonuclease [unclassified Beijerinckia]MDH7795795.1 5-methylcytosine-specific restriction protein A [Beijerinckia sp. GAS462]SEC16724.1 HNH endonuclease [Beijerinckia sp. 28-YEA-48]
MPSRGPRICTCGKIVQAGALCVCQAARRRINDRRRPSAHERGYTSKWQRERAEYLRLHPHCTFCGRIANVVDHRIPHKGDMPLFWDRSNWQPLCVPCHNSRKQIRERKCTS